MARYVLGESAARKFRELVAGRMRYGHRDGGGSAFVDDADFAQPYEVRWSQSQNDGEGAWIIWLPAADVLIVEGVAVDLTADLEAAEADYPSGWYKLDVLPAEGGSLFLTVKAPGGESESETSGGVSADGAGETSSGEAMFALERVEDAVSVLICDAFESKSVRQIVTSAVVIGAGAVTTDNVSIAFGGKKDGVEASEGGRNVLQLAHFTDGQMDSAKGLTARLRVDTETGEISVVGDDSLMLVARQGGRLVYIPLGGSGDEDAGGTDDGTNDPCVHPGGGGSVDAGDSVPGEEPAGPEFGVGGDVGVPAEGSVEIGVNDCC